MKLIGMITLPYPTRVSGGGDKDTVTERGTRVAFDQDGTPWLLVERWEHLGALATGLARGNLVRMTYSRWMRCEPFPTTEDPPFKLFADVHPAKTPFAGGDDDDDRKPRS